MGEFILGAAIALFVGMRLARLIDGRRSARGAHTKAKGAVPGARKKAFAATFAFFRFALVLVLVLMAAAYGWMRHNS